MVEARDLLIEIGSEELPPKALRGLSGAFGAGIRKGLEDQGLDFHGLRLYATPRRLAVQVLGLSTAQPDQVKERRGPALSAAFDKNGRPTQAALGFAQSCAVEVSQLERLETEKGAWLVCRTQVKGRPTRDIIPGLLEQVLAQLPIPKRMRWTNIKESFVRPVHWLVLLLGDEVIPMQMFGLHAGRETYGHRFHRPQSLYLTDPALYAPLLETQCYVMPDFDARRETVRARVLEAAQGVGGRALIDEDLLDEVTSLTEWPMALVGRFDEGFLTIPHEAIISTMQGNQRYFPILDAAGRLMPAFVVVSNIESREPEKVIEGNERVIRPRLADAAFFWDQDRKFPLEDHLKDLHTVVFQERLGSLYDKTLRVAALSEHIATLLGWNQGFAHRAAMLCKCDLMTSMVGEFPELQGTLGRYIAANDGEPAEVATAVEEVYMPRFAGGELPRTPTGQVLAIADRLDTLVGIFGIGQPPSGDRDPFGLRRAALGVLRILIERTIPLDLWRLLQAAVKGYQDRLQRKDVAGEVFAFMLERLRAYYLEKGVRPDEFEAVLALEPREPYDFDQRVHAVAAFRKLPEAESLAAANKRIRNILRQAAERREPVPEQVDTNLLQDPAERALYERMTSLEVELGQLFLDDRYHYTQVLARLASLRDSVDTFFDKVMVMVEDASLRANRLALLSRLSEMFLQVADVSRLQG
jgi:glycyl-tRNA synthetase beta chain